jgi:hypothetical protein
VRPSRRCSQPILSVAVIKVIKSCPFFLRAGCYHFDEFLQMGVIVQGFRRLAVIGASLAMGALPLVAMGSAPASASAPAGRIQYMSTINGSAKGNAGHHQTRSSNLYYHGGISDPSVKIGVETAPKVYLVFWGSQWNNNDPYGEAAILQSFYSNVGGSSWNNSVTQYCQGVAIGTSLTPCSGSGAAGNPSGVLWGSWYDGGLSAPSQPNQSQLAAEAVNAAGHFGNSTVSSNASVQYVIATATGNSMLGFGTQWCAWHSSTTSTTTGDIAYTNLPYITDAGASCGANFNGLGFTAGVTIVGGHEFAETETDQFPNGGWLDGSGAENGDKCAWNSSTTNVLLNLSSSVSYPVQPLWSNAANSGTGGCVLSYP